MLNVDSQGHGEYEIPVGPSRYTGDVVFVRELFENQSFVEAGGILVQGEPWKNEPNKGTWRVYFSYRDYSRFTKEITEKIQNSGQNYDAVVTMPKGGVAIGAHIANTLRKPLGYFHANSYGKKEKGGDMQFGDFNTGPGFPTGNVTGKGKKPRILLVDDLADTGKTFLAVKTELEAQGYEVDTAAIFHKANPGVEKPTHCLFENYPPLWIVQPLEGHLEKGSPTESHNVYNIRNHKITRYMLKIAEEIGGLLRQLPEKKDAKKKLKIFLPQQASYIQTMIATGVARLIEGYTVEFSPEYMVPGQRTGIPENSRLKYRIDRDSASGDVTLGVTPSLLQFGN